MTGNIKKRLCILALAVVFSVYAFCMPVSASERIDMDAETSLELEFIIEENIPAQGVGFSIYKVADTDPTGRIIVIDRYSSYPVVIDDDIDQNGWNMLSATLSGYIAADGIEADKTAVTDENGIAVFTDLEAGLYLVVGEEFSANRKIYSPGSFMIFLPGLDENDEWVYAVKARPKFTSRPDSEPVDIEVIKIWDDGEGEDRPPSITVELYDADTLYDTVVLDKTNDWSYRWENLYGGTTYSIVEKDVPEGYKVSVEKQNTAFIITNKGPEPPTPPELPYTGVLWWPAYVLFAAGIVLIVAGYLKNRSGADEK